VQAFHDVLSGDEGIVSGKVRTSYRRTELLIYWADWAAKEDLTKQSGVNATLRGNSTSATASLEHFCSKFVMNANRNRSCTVKARDLGRGGHYMNGHLLPWFVITRDAASLRSVLRLVWTNWPPNIRP